MRQQTWDAIAIRSADEQLLASLVTPLQRARFLGALAPHSADWLGAMPISNSGLFLNDDEVRIAVGLRLNPVFATLMPLREGIRCPCSALFRMQKRLWQANATQLAQRNSGQVVAKYRDSGQKEPLGLCSNEAGTTQGKRPDGVTLIPWRRGRCVTWDVTVADTYSASYVGIRLYGLAPQLSGQLGGNL